MVDQNISNREQELNTALEAIHFGYRAITAKPDQRLASQGYSRVHHRALYFIARNTGCSVNELLGIMRVTKQYLNRPLQRLIEDKYVLVKPDPSDKRVKRLHLSKKGARLENELTGNQRAQFQQVFKDAGPQAEEGWRKVMVMLAELGKEL
jgi:DNA-binding MarR family transcriptional regulator